MRKLIIDVKNLAFRTGWPNLKLTDPQGNAVGPLYGMLRSLGAISQYFPDCDEMILCCDPTTPGSNPYWRREIFADYKRADTKVSATGVALREAVNRCLPIFRDVATMMPVTWFEDPNEEADDLMVYAAFRYKPEKESVIVSNDRDMIQLAKFQGVTIAVPHKAQQFMPVAWSSFDSYFRELVKQKISKTRVPGDLKLPSPVYWLAFRALQGDKSDNIPGLLGCGPKMAVDIISRGAQTTDATDAATLLGAWWHWVSTRGKDPGAREAALIENNPDATAVLQRGEALMVLDPRSGDYLLRSSFTGQYNSATLAHWMRSLNFQSLEPGGTYEHQFTAAMERFFNGASVI